MSPLTKQISMIQVRPINSEMEIQKDVVKNFKRRRTVNQTAFYLDSGADHYYNPDKKFSGEQYDYHKITQLLENILVKKKSEKIVIVSLGCGSCEKDKIVLEHLQEKGYNNIRFFGVDSSIAMIQKATSVLDEATFDANLICADFGVAGFKEGLNKIIGHYDIGIYLFFGNTFGNLNQSYIADVLRNILHEGDYLLLDIIGFEEITTTIQASLFQRYLGYLDNPADVKFSLSPFDTFGIPKDCGKLTLQVTTDAVTQARVYLFGFKVETSTDFNIEREAFNLAPNEEVSLHFIMIYDLNELNKFLKTKKFEVKEKIIGKFLNQLLLEKKE